PVRSSLIRLVSFTGTLGRRRAVMISTTVIRFSEGRNCRDDWIKIEIGTPVAADVSLSIGSPNSSTRSSGEVWRMVQYVVGRNADSVLIRYAPNHRQTTLRCPRGRKHLQKKWSRLFQWSQPSPFLEEQVPGWDSRHSWSGCGSSKVADKQPWPEGLGRACPGLPWSN